MSADKGTSKRRKVLQGLSASVLQFFYNLRGTYWFVPTLMVVGAIALSVVTLLADQRYEPESIGDLGRWFPAHSLGSRSVLSTIAASMIGVAGVTFSMTLVSVSFAAAQYGPRLIGNFMRDRGNQVTLGTFVATFVYALLVLRRVREGSDELDSFVPHLSVLVALALTLVSIGVLVYFIHHVPETINVSRITAGIGRQLGREVEQVFPAGVGEGGEEAGLLADPARNGRQLVEPDPDPWPEHEPVDELESRSAGFVTSLNEERMLELARRADLVLRVQYRPGDFVARGDRLLWIHPRGRADEELLDDLHGCFALGAERTADQDVLFLVDQLVEITARALSPGINDPYTAVACLQWLASALSVAVERDPPAAARADEDGKLRLVVHPVTFERLLARAWGRSMQYVARDRIASFASLDMIAEVAVRATRAGRPARRELALEHARRLARSCNESLPLSIDRDQLATRLETLERIAPDPGAARAKRDDQSWLGGTG